MKNFTPIIIFSYIRKNELKFTIESLLQNKNLNRYHVFIFNDYVKNSEDEYKMNEVRKYLFDLKNRNVIENLYLIFREKNYGLAKNIIEGVSEVIEKYDRVIVLEDDLIVSRNFLCYMTNALDFYYENKNIFSISGYTMPLKSLKKYSFDTYFALRPSSWGWATWKDRWQNIDWNVKDFEQFINNKNEIKKFNMGGVDLTRMLQHYKQGKNNSWAIRWAYAMFKNKQLSVYPTISKVQNIGFGQNATHCKGINIYQTILDNTDKCDFNFIENDINYEILKEFKFQYSYINKFIKKLRNIIKGL